MSNVNSTRVHVLGLFILCLPNTFTFRLNGPSDNTVYEVTIIYDRYLVPTHCESILHRLCSEAMLHRNRSDLIKTCKT